MFAATEEKESPAYATLLQSLPAFITEESDSDCEKLVNSYEQRLRELRGREIRGLPTMALVKVTHLAASITESGFAP